MSSDAVEEVIKKVDVEPEVTKRRQITIADLTNQLNAASQRMSNINPHKTLILNAAYALQQLVQRLDGMHRTNTILVDRLKEAELKLQGSFRSREVTIVRP